MLQKVGLGAAWRYFLIGELVDEAGVPAERLEEVQLVSEGQVAAALLVMPEGAYYFRLGGFVGP